MPQRECDGCERGAPFIGPYRIADQCRVCWLYHNDPQYKAYYDGQPIPEQKTAAGIDPECVKARNQSMEFGGAVMIHGNGFPATRPGPGTQLHTLFSELGLTGWSGCPCAARARQMDTWGAEGCKVHRGEIIGWMKEAREHLSWMEMLKAATLLAFKVNPLDPLGSLLDEAIRRAAM